MTTAQIRKQVISVLREVLSDPDHGLELTAYVKKRLAVSARSRKAGKMKPLSDVLAKYKAQ